MARMSRSLATAVAVLGLIASAALWWSFAHDSEGSGFALEPAEVGPADRGDGGAAAVTEDTTSRTPRHPAATAPKQAFVDLSLQNLEGALPEICATLVRLEHPEYGHTVLGERYELGIVAGRAEVRIPVPPNEPIAFDLAGSGFSISTRAEALVLQAGEIRPLVLDLSQTCAVRGQLLGVPAPDGQRVVLEHLAARAGDHGHRPLVQLETRTRADGEFEFPGVPRGWFLLGLRTATGTSLPLTDAEGRGSFSACTTPVLRVAPARPVIGIAPVDGQGEILVGDAFGVRWPGNAAQPYLHVRGIALVEREHLASAEEGGIFLPERGYFPIDPAAAAAHPDDLLHVQVIDRDPQGGGVRVVMGEPLPEGVILDLLRHGPYGPERLVDYQLAHLQRATRGLHLERLADGARLHALPPGLYDLICHHEGSRELAREIQVLAGVETLVHVAPPRLLALEGQVARWDEIPSTLRPVQVWFDGMWSFIHEGRFEVRTFDPLPDSVWVRGPGEHWSQAACVRTEGSPTVTLHFAFEALVRTPLPVQPRFGGRLVAQVERPAVVRQFDPPLALLGNFQPEGDGSLILASNPESPPTGCVLELVPDGRRFLRGWFDLALPEGPRPADFDGRWCELHLHPPGSLVEVLLEGPGKPGSESIPVRVVTVASGSIAPVWLPAGTRAVRWRDRLGAAGRVDLQELPDSLEVRVRSH